MRTSILSLAANSTGQSNLSTTAVTGFIRSVIPPPIISNPHVLLPEVTARSIHHSATFEPSLGPEIGRQL